MSLESDKQTVARMLEAFNEGRLEIVDEVMADGAVDHSLYPGLPSGREGVKALITTARAAFPDLKNTLIRQVAEGDIVMQQVRSTGTMTGDFMGMKATGKSATWETVHIVRMQDGKLAEHWSVADNLGMLQQLGLAPASPVARAA